MTDTALNQPTLKGKWNELKGAVKERWGKLTDDDLDMIEGRRDQLVGKIQQAYGQARHQAEQELEEWERQRGLR